SYTTDGLEEGIGSDLDFRPPQLDVAGPDDDALPSPARCWLWAAFLTHPDSAAKDKTRPRAVAAPLLRELIGNPFRRVTLNPSQPHRAPPGGASPRARDLRGRALRGPADPRGRPGGGRLHERRPSGALPPGR